MHLFSKENIWSNPQQFPAYSNDPVIQTRIIILWTELFPKKRREKIQGEILQSIFEYRIQWCFHIPTRFLRIQCIPTRTTRTTVFLHAIQQVSSHPVLEILLQEILQLQGSSRVIPCIQGIFQQLFPVHPSILHGRIQP